MVRHPIEARTADLPWSFTYTRMITKPCQRKEIVRFIILLAVWAEEPRVFGPTGNYLPVPGPVDLRPIHVETWKTGLFFSL